MDNEYKDTLQELTEYLAEQMALEEQKTSVINITKMRQFKSVHDTLEDAFIGDEYYIWHDEFTWSKYYGSIYLESDRFDVFGERERAFLYALKLSDSYSIIVTDQDKIRFGFGFRGLSTPIE